MMFGVFKRPKPTPDSGLVRVNEILSAIAAQAAALAVDQKNMSVPNVAEAFDLPVKKSLNG